jgi:hypothetical protein
MDQKLCDRCEIVKALTAFSKRKASKDGLQNYCKECNKVNNTQYRKDNPNFFMEWYNRNEDNRIKAKFNNSKSHARWGGGVYLVINKPEEKMYIGVTNKLARRKIEHWNQKELGKLSSGLKELYEDMKRIGRDNFEFVILELVDPNNEALLFTRENWWLNFFSNKDLSLYNRNFGNKGYSKYHEVDYPGENL